MTHLKIICPYHNKVIVFDHEKYLWYHTDGTVCYESNYLVLKRDKILKKYIHGKTDFRDILLSRIDENFIASFFEHLNSSNEIESKYGEILVSILGSDLDNFIEKLSDFVSNDFKVVKSRLEYLSKSMLNEEKRRIVNIIANLSGKTVRDADALKENLLKIILHISKFIIDHFRFKIYDLKIWQETKTDKAAKEYLLWMLKKITAKNQKAESKLIKAERRYEFQLSLIRNKHGISELSKMFLRDEKLYSVIRPFVLFAEQFNEILLNKDYSITELFEEAVIELFTTLWGYKNNKLTFWRMETEEDSFVDLLSISAAVSSKYLPLEIFLVSDKRTKNFKPSSRNFVMIPINDPPSLVEIPQNLSSELLIYPEDTIIDRVAKIKDLHKVYRYFYIAGLSFYKTSQVGFQTAKEFLEKIAGLKIKSPLKNLILWADLAFKHLNENIMLATPSPDYILYFNNEILESVVEVAVRDLLSRLSNLPKYYSEILKYALVKGGMNTKELIDQFLFNIYKIAKIKKIDAEATEYSMLIDSFYFVLIETILFYIHRFFIAARLGLLKARLDILEKFEDEKPETETLLVDEEEKKLFDTFAKIFYPAMIMFYTTAFSLFAEYKNEKYSKTLEKIDREKLKKQLLKSIKKTATKNKLEIEEKYIEAYVERLVKWILHKKRKIDIEEESKKMLELRRKIEEKKRKEKQSEFFKIVEEAMKKQLEKKEIEEKKRKQSGNHVDSFDFKEILGEVEEESVSEQKKVNPASIKVVLGTLPIYNGLSLVSSRDGIVYINEHFLDVLGEKIGPKNLEIVLDVLIAHEKAKIMYSDETVEKFFDNILETFGKSGYSSSLIVSFIKTIFNLLNDARVDFLYSLEYPRYYPMFTYYTLIFLAPAFENLYVLNPNNTIIPVYQVLLLISRLKITDFEQLIEKLPSKSKYVLEKILSPNVVRMLVSSSMFKNTIDVLTASIYVAMEILDALESVYSRKEILEFISQINTVRRLVIEDLEEVKRYVMEIHRYMLKDLDAFIAKLFKAFPKLIRDKILKHLYTSENLRIILKSVKNAAKMRAKTEHWGYGSYSPPRMIYPNINDHLIYMKTINKHRETIRRLREAVEKIKIEYEEDRKTWGDLIEEKMMEAYIWSYTRDVPAPLAFSGYTKILPNIDIIIHLDHSGSMVGAEGELVTEAAIVISESLRPLIETPKSKIRLAVSAFGTDYHIIKYPLQKIEAGRYNFYNLGGTAIFETLADTIDKIYDQLRENSKKLIIIFTDTMDSEYDLEKANEMLEKIRRKIGDFYTVLISTNGNVLEEIRKFADTIITINTVDDLPNIIVDSVLKMIKKWGIRKIF